MSDLDVFKEFRALGEGKYSSNNAWELWAMLDTLISHTRQCAGYLLQNATLTAAGVKGLWRGCTDVEFLVRNCQPVNDEKLARIVQRWQNFIDSVQQDLDKAQLQGWWIWRLVWPSDTRTADVLRDFMIVCKTYHTQTKECFALFHDYQELPTVKANSVNVNLEELFAKYEGLRDSADQLQRLMASASKNYVDALCSDKDQ